MIPTTASDFHDFVFSALFSSWSVTAATIGGTRFARLYTQIVTGPTFSPEQSLNALLFFVETMPPQKQEYLGNPADPMERQVEFFFNNAGTAFLKALECTPCEIDFALLRDRICERKGEAFRDTMGLVAGINKLQEKQRIKEEDGSWEILTEAKVKGKTDDDEWVLI